MKKLLVFVGLVLLFSFVSPHASAQYYFYDNDHYDTPLIFEVGGSVGAMNSLTDLGGRKGIGKKFVKDLNLNKTNVCGSIFLGATYRDMIMFKLEAAFGKVQGDDAVLKKVAPSTFGRYERNLNFRSKITEFSGMFEIHPLYIFNNYNGDNDKTPPSFSPYITAGVGLFSFNPQAKTTNGWVDLQPLSTEGQGFAEYPDRKVYKLRQINFPVGAGVKYEILPNINLRAEFVYRILNTDYLDDVSTDYIDPTLYPNYFTGAKLTNAFLLNDRQYELDPTHITNPGDQRGNSKNKDAYFSFNLKVSYTFGRERIRR
jgi:hypothetical protein